MTEENPYRIELWGDSVESIRSFDVLSQRSVENLDEIAIYPATELMLSEARRQDGFARIKKETKHRDFKPAIRLKQAALCIQRGE